MYHIQRFTLISHSQDSMDIDLINVLGIEAHDIKSHQQKDTYCKCLYNTLKIPSVKNKFTIKDNTLLKTVQDVDEYMKSWYSLDL